MKKGGRRKGALGFTIVETLIVLAVSGMLVLSAIILISGRSNKTQFMTASNDLKQQLQQLLNETATGYFPNAGNFSCTAGINTMPALSNSGSQAQGTNGGCLFLGKAFQFGPTDYPDQYLAYAITGNRLQTGTSTEVTTLAQSFPEAVAPGLNHNSTLTGITASQNLENGLAIGSMKYSGGNIGGFALLSTLASYTAGGSNCNGVCSGSQSFSLYAIDKSAITGMTSKSFADVLDGQGAASSAANYIPTSSVTLCFNSGTTSQSAIYTIGANGDSQGVDMQIQAGACS